MEEKQAFIKRVECRKFDQIIKWFPGPIFVLDTETTGVKPQQDRIIQISAVRLDRNASGQYQITNYLDQYIKPPFPVPDAASAVNYITNDFLADKPTEEQVFPIIRQFLWDAEIGNGIVLGYNNHRFDDVIISCMYERRIGKPFCPICSVDCMKLAEEIVKRSSLPDQSLKLSNVANLYGVLEENMHNALTDILVTGRLAFRLYEDYIDNYKQNEIIVNNKSKIVITGMYRFKKSKTVNYIMITGSVMTPEGVVVTGKIRYDVWDKRYYQDEGSLFAYGDFDTFVDDANQYAGGDIAKYKYRK